MLKEGWWQWYQVDMSTLYLWLSSVSEAHADSVSTVYTLNTALDTQTLTSLNSDKKADVLIDAAAANTNTLHGDNELDHHNTQQWMKVRANNHQS